MQITFDDVFPSKLSINKKTNSMTNRKFKLLNDNVREFKVLWAYWRIVSETIFSLTCYDPLSSILKYFWETINEITYTSKKLKGNCSTGTQKIHKILEITACTIWFEKCLRLISMQNSRFVVVKSIRRIALWCRCSSIPAIPSIGYKLDGGQCKASN